MAFWVWLFLAASLGATLGWAVAYPLARDAGYLEGRRDGRNATIDEQRQAQQRASVERKERVLRSINRKGGRRA